MGVRPEKSAGLRSGLLLHPAGISAQNKARTIVNRMASLPTHGMGVLPMVQVFLHVDCTRSTQQERSVQSSSLHQKTLRSFFASLATGSHGVPRLAGKMPVLLSLPACASQARPTS